MIIVDQRPVRFGDVEDGECFEYAHHLHIACSDFKNRKHAVDLESGVVFDLAGDTVVVPVKCSMAILRYTVDDDDDE